MSGRFGGGGLPVRWVAEGSLRLKALAQYLTIFSLLWAEGGVQLVIQELQGRREIMKTGFIYFFCLLNTIDFRRKFLNNYLLALGYL